MELSLGNIAYFERWRRYRRRRRYQRLNDEGGKKRIKGVRLGGGPARRIWKLSNKLRWKLISPVKILVKFHDAYVGMMIDLGNKMGKWNNKGLLGGGKLAKDKNISVVSSGEEVIDNKLVFEIYKRLAVSREVRDF